MEKSVEYIKEKIKNFKPQTGIILGSGLGDFAEIKDSIAIPYTDIPNFEKSSVKGHKGQLVFANIEGKNVVIMQGRYHFYEGHSMQVVTYPVKVMKKLGIETLIITNAAGAINDNFKPSELMFITDHINYMGTNPLIGVNDESLGTQFPDMSEIYSKELINKAENIAKELGIKTHRGIYVATSGPSYETPAEINMFKIMGASAVGMSTVPEAITAKWCGLKILGISCLTNYAAGITNFPLSHNEVIETANKIKYNFKKLLRELLPVT